MTEESNDHLISMSASTMGKDLIGFFIQEFRAMPDVWQKLPKHKQDEVLERARKRVTSTVKEAVRIINSQGRVVLKGQVAGTTIANGIETKIKMLSTDNPNISELLELRKGDDISLLLSHSDQFLGDIEEVTGDDDQGDWVDDNTPTSTSGKTLGEILNNDEKKALAEDPLYDQAKDHCINVGFIDASSIKRRLQLEDDDRIKEIVESLENDDRLTFNELSEPSDEDLENEEELTMLQPDDMPPEDIETANDYE